MEFKSYNKIRRLENANMTITQKLNGTNALVVVFTNEKGELDLKTGSRTRWITPEDDNFGFSKFVHDNKEEFIDLLGEGWHYGEWIGPGINSGEGLDRRKFVLFEWYRFVDAEFPPNTMTVPVLYKGSFDSVKIQEVLGNLKAQGSALVPGFMRPEGIVIDVDGKKYKAVFEAEETGWRKPSLHPKEVNKEPKTDYSYLCQPIRLEKLLSKDEAYLRDYPKSLSAIVNAYVSDLIEENQITGDEDAIKLIKKNASSQIFVFIKQFMK